jgi:hypothetical protein
VIEITDWAAEVLARSLDAARRLNPDAVIKLVRRGDRVEPVLAERAGADDVVMAGGAGVEVAVEAGLDGVLDVEPPHDRLVLKPPGSAPSPRDR